FSVCFEVVVRCLEHDCNVDLQQGLPKLIWLANEPKLHSSNPFFGLREGQGKFRIAQHCFACSGLHGSSQFLGKLECEDGLILPRRRGRVIPQSLAEMVGSSDVQMSVVLAEQV